MTDDEFRYKLLEDIKELQTEIRELHLLLLEADGLLALQDQAEELQAQRERKRKAYRTKRQHAQDRAEVLGIPGGLVLSVSDPAEDDAPAFPEVEELRARLRRGKATIVRQGRPDRTDTPLPTASELRARLQRGKAKAVCDDR